MTRVPFLRLLLLLSMFLLLALSSVISPNVQAQISPQCTQCRRACLNDYVYCVSIGALGCEEVYAACVADCPCP